MKRTNLVLDEQLLEEAVKVSGERTYSAAVHRALEAFVRRARARQILSLAGSGLWQGDLATVREDRVLPDRVREAPVVYRAPRRRRGSR
jgi:Arc/MetJ family transcription regulator